LSKKFYMFGEFPQNLILKWYIYVLVYNSRVNQLLLYFFLKLFIAGWMALWCLLKSFYSMSSHCSHFTPSNSISVPAILMFGRSWNLSIHSLEQRSSCELNWNSIPIPSKAFLMASLLELWSILDLILAVSGAQEINTIRSRSALIPSLPSRAMIAWNTAYRQLSSGKKSLNCLNCSGSCCPRLNLSSLSLTISIDFMSSLILKTQHFVLLFFTLR